MLSLFCGEGKAGSLMMRDCVFCVSRVNRWNDPENNWKKAPFNVERIPTIIKLPAGEAESIEAKVRPVLLFSLSRSRWADSFGGHRSRRHHESKKLRFSKEVCSNHS